MSSRRSTELWLLIAAAPVVLLLFAMLLINQGVELSLAAFAVPLGLIAAFAVAHVFARFFAPQADPGILPVVFLLAGIGICFVLRLTPEETALKQVAWLFAGVACMVLTIVFVPSIDKLARYRYVILLAGLLLLLSPMLPVIGREYYGSRIWLSVAGMSFQPGELAKICIVLFLASYLADHREMLSTFGRGPLGLPVPHWRTMLPVIGMWLVAMLVIVFEKDLGSALLLFGVFLAMVYVSTGRLSYVVLGLALAAAGCVVLYGLFDHVQTRVAIWRDPFAFAQESGYQLVQSLYSLADGGLFGVGIGRGLCTTIPMVESDFIFCAVAEEMGLLGASAVLILFVLFAVRGLATAARAKSDVAAFTAAGLTASISLQAFIIVGGATGLIPLTGITLPFMSQGGSSLIASFIIVGLLLKAGNEATGLATEMTGTMQISRAQLDAAANPADGGVLGRASLGRRLTMLVGCLSVLIALGIGNLSYVQVVQADELQSREGNNHTLARQAQRERGVIMTSDDVVLAQSTKGKDGSYEREYPQGSLASHAVGYYSQQYGSAGIEASMSSALVGEESFETIGDAARAAAGLQNSGNDVVLTLDADVQRTAEQQLDGLKGAIVALDASTGAVLAQASAPGYNANQVGDLVSGKIKNRGQLVNRATQSLYTPGSTYKAVTLAGALDSGLVTPDTKVKSPSSVNIGGAPVTTHGDRGTITVKQAFAVSSNTAFGQLAVDMGAQALVNISRAFGVGYEDLAQDFAVTASLMPDPAEMTEWETAWAGAGQPVGEHASPAGPQVTVTQMAVIMAAIANGGVVMRPYIVDSVMSHEGKVISSTAPAALGQAIGSQAASDECDIMEYCVTNGTGGNVAISGVRVMGKTGTGETGDGKENAWFIAAGQKGGRTVAVAVCIEDAADEGAVVAAPKARAVLQSALRELGVLE